MATLAVMDGFDYRPAIMAPPPEDELPPPSTTVTSPTATSPIVSQQRINPEQFVELKKLIDDYISKLTKPEIETSFSPWRAIVFLALAVSAFSISIRWLNSIDPKPSEKYAITQYVVQHLTVYIALISVIIPLYKIFAYILRQYYHVRKYRLLMINRTAIFSTILLNGGTIPDSTLMHFISEIPENTDSLDIQTIHEKLIDKISDNMKEGMKFLARLNDGKSSK